MEVILEQLKKINPIDDKDYVSDDEEKAEESFTNFTDNKQKTSDQPMKTYNDQKEITTADIVHSLSSPFVKLAKFYDDDIEFDDKDDNKKGKHSKNWELVSDFYAQGLTLKTALGSNVISKFKMFHQMMKEQDRISIAEAKDLQTLTNMVYTMQKKDKKEEGVSTKYKGNTSITKPTTANKLPGNSSIKSGDVSRSQTIRKNSSSTVNKRQALSGVESNEINSAQIAKKTLQTFGAVIDSKRFREIQPYYYRQNTKQEIATAVPDFHTEPIFTLIENIDKSMLIGKLD